MMKRIGSFLLALALIIGLLPAMAFEAEAASESWLWPVKGIYGIGSNYGLRDLDGDGTLEDYHKGIDINGHGSTVGSASGQPVLASKSGTIYKAVNTIADNTFISGSFGNCVWIDHGDGTYSLYAHLKPDGVKTSGTVKQGEVIGYIGNTGSSYGAHLHFQIYTEKNNWGGSTLNPMPTNSNISIKNTYQLPSGWPSAKTTYIFEPVSHVDETYRCYGQLEVTSDTTYVKSLPCSEKTDPNSTNVEGRAAVKGNLYTAIGLVKNTAGNLWYKITTSDGKTGYIFSGDVEYTHSTADVSVSGVSAPTEVKLGNAFSLKGVITAKYQTLRMVGAWVDDENGEYVIGTTQQVNTSSYDLYNSYIDVNTKFNDITKEGSYQYFIGATIQSYYAKSTTEVGTTAQKTIDLYETNFKVVKSTSCSHSYSSKVTAPTYTEQGYTTYTCTKCGYSYKSDYTPVLEAYTVYFDANGGTGAPGTQTVSAEEELVIPTTVPERLGYYFRGWSFSADSSSVAYVPGESTSIGGDMTLYAVWSQAWDFLSTEFSSMRFQDNVDFPNEHCMYKFVPLYGGYYDIYSESDCDTVLTVYDSQGNVIASDDDSGDNNNFNLHYEFQAGQTYYLKTRLYGEALGRYDIVVRRQIEYCTVYYNANGGTGAPDDQTVQKNNSFTVSTTVPERMGYYFLGWSLADNASGAELVPGEAVSVGGNVTLYAVWAPADDLSQFTPISWLAGGIKVTFPNEYRVWKFTPISTGYYDIFSDGDVDAVLTVYDSQGNVVASNDDGGEERNFFLHYELQGGQVYYLRMNLYGASLGEFDVNIKRRTACVVETSPDVTLKNGETTTISVKAIGTGLTYKWYRAKPGENAYYYVADGSELQLTGSMAYNGYRYACIVTDDMGTESWSRDITLTVARHGWYKENGTWYYYNRGTKLTGWLTEGGKTYYLRPDGSLVSSWYKVGNKWYFFNGSGEMQTSKWKYWNGDYYYLKADGAMATGLTLIDGKYYYFNGDGIMKMGWISIGGTRYCFTGDGSARTGWYSNGGNWYYLQETGAVTYGWVNIGGAWYYFDGNGAMKTGWISTGGKWYYSNSNGVMQTGWVSVGGKWYYMNSSGEMQTGWVKVGKLWYYFNSSGVMLTGWQKIDGSWYYFNSSGAMLTGTHTIDGTKYTFNSSGVWIA